MKWLLVLVLSGCSVTVELQMSTGEGGMQEVSETEQKTQAEVDTGL